MVFSKSNWQTHLISKCPCKYLECASFENHRNFLDFFESDGLLQEYQVGRIQNWPTHLEYNELTPRRGLCLSTPIFQNDKFVLFFSGNLTKTEHIYCEILSALAQFKIQIISEHLLRKMAILGSFRTKNDQSFKHRNLNLYWSKMLRPKFFLTSKFMSFWSKWPQILPSIIKVSKLSEF